MMRVEIPLLVICSLNCLVILCVSLVCFDAVDHRPSAPPTSLFLFCNSGLVLPEKKCTTISTIPRSSQAAFHNDVEVVTTLLSPSLAPPTLVDRTPTRSISGAQFHSKSSWRPVPWVLCAVRPPPTELDTPLKRQ